MLVRGFAAGTVLLAALVAPASAQESVDVRRATSATGPMEVHVMSGEVRLVAWNRNEVHVTGELGREGERLEVSPQGDRLVVRVHPVRSSRGHGSDLEIRFPARRSLQVTTVSADISVEGGTGAAVLHTVSGNVQVEGQPASLTVNSRSGDIMLDGSTGRLIANTISGGVQVTGSVREQAEIHTVQGDIELHGPVGMLHAQSVAGSIVAERVGTAAEVQTVSGEISIVARSLVGKYNTVSGDISLSGAPGRMLEVHTHSGELDMRFPRGTNADVEINTWSGEVNIDMGGARLMQNSAPRSRQVRLGSGGTRVELSTFSGTVRVQEQ